MYVEKRPEERRIGDEAKAAMKQLVPEELATLVEESLDDILCMSYHNAQIGILSDMYNVLGQVLWDLLREDLSSETLDAHTANFFDTHAAFIDYRRNF